MYIIWFFSWWIEWQTFLPLLFIPREYWIRARRSTHTHHQRLNVHWKSVRFFFIVCALVIGSHIRRLVHSGRDYTILLSHRTYVEYRQCNMVKHYFSSDPQIAERKPKLSKCIFGGLFENAIMYVSVKKKRKKQLAYEHVNFIVHSERGKKKGKKVNKMRAVTTSSLGWVWVHFAFVCLMAICIVAAIVFSFFYWWSWTTNIKLHFSVNRFSVIVIISNVS